jgi:hypothetical protein
MLLDMNWINVAFVLTIVMAAIIITATLPVVFYKIAYAQSTTVNLKTT